MANVEPHAVAAVEPLHALAQIRIGRLDNRVVVVVHEGVGVNAPAIARVRLGQQLQEVLAVALVGEDVTTFRAASEDMVLTIRNRVPQARGFLDQ